MQFFGKFKICYQKRQRITKQTPTTSIHCSPQRCSCHIILDTSTILLSLTQNRISAHFNSTMARKGDRTVFDLFRCATVYVSEKISKSIILFQSLQTFTVQCNQANCHIEELDGQLKLYVPSDERNRELCYLQQLPKSVLRFLSISDSSAETVLVQVLGSSSLDIVNVILEDAGIIELDIPTTTLDINIGTDHTTLPSEVQVSLTSPANQDAASTSAENEGHIPVEDENSTKSSPILVPPGAVLSASSNSIGRSPSVPGDLDEEDVGNSDASSTSDSGLNPASSTPSVESGEGFDWIESFLQVCCDSLNDGTIWSEFRAHIERDLATSQNVHYQSITFQEPHQDFSFEELRLYDHCLLLDLAGTSTTAQPPSKDRAYAELLNHVIDSASSAVFPLRGDAPNPAAAPRSTFTTTFGIDKKIGAAGELYVRTRFWAILL